jgi:hypothetical protein
MSNEYISFGNLPEFTANNQLLSPDLETGFWGPEYCTELGTV